jgi:uncharacterized protein DUF5615
MKLYLDDDCASRFLRQAGHQVELPIEAELSGASDPVHLTHAVREGSRLLTANFVDFQELHDLIRQAGGHHSGILIVRRDNNPKRDLSPRGIVRAIAKLEAAELSLEDQFVILNQWR